MQVAPLSSTKCKRCHMGGGGGEALFSILPSPSSLSPSNARGKIIDTEDLSQ